MISIPQGFIDLLAEVIRQELARKEKESELARGREGDADKTTPIVVLKTEAVRR